jgi:hypothetical protein
LSESYTVREGDQDELFALDFHPDGPACDRIVGSIIGCFVGDVLGLANLLAEKTIS